MDADDRSDEMPYAGIASYYKAPYMPRPSAGDADVAVLGIPYDGGTSGRSGARMGPRALRDASTNWAFQYAPEAFWDGEAEVHVLGGVSWVDCGDVVLGPSPTVEQYHGAVIERLQPIAEAGLFPLTLGGDHSVAYPAMKAVSLARGGDPFHLVQFDAHLDYWDEEAGQRFTHESSIIRAHEERLVSGLTQYGIRGLHTAYDNIDLARRRGSHIFWCEQARRTRTEDMVAHLEPGVDTYITFDVDALDPAIAPGTGTPEPGGFTYYEAKALLLAVCARCNVIGMDVVEVAPIYDGPGQLTALHAVRLIMDAVGATFRRRDESE